jgi:hypothetical protein
VKRVAGIWLVGVAYGVIVYLLARYAVVEGPHPDVPMHVGIAGAVAYIVGALSWRD